MPDGEIFTLPVVVGILKHPSAEMLPLLLSKPDAAIKYSVAALQKASWPILRLFPRQWLLLCIPRQTYAHRGKKPYASCWQIEFFSLISKAIMAAK
jgi:hypothetical protein